MPSQTSANRSLESPPNTSQPQAFSGTNGNSPVHTGKTRSTIQKCATCCARTAFASETSAHSKQHRPGSPPQQTPRQVEKPNLAGLEAGWGGTSRLTTWEVSSASAALSDP